MAVNKYEVVMILACLILICIAIQNFWFLIRNRIGKKSGILEVVTFWIIALYPFIQCWLDDWLNGQIRKELYVLFFFSTTLMKGISAVIEEMYVVDNRASLEAGDQKTPIAWMGFLGMLQLYYCYLGNSSEYSVGYGIILIACLLFSCFYHNKK
ncbi:MAG: hypothetical protein IKL07_02555 [Clostridium sp.]|nr:hypothetical protein [Clostridium sp.]